MALAKTLYAFLWAENQLKSLCDPSNLPTLLDRYDLQYSIFTDEETYQAISAHPNFQRLSHLCEIQLIKLEWPPNVDRFSQRYGLLVSMFHSVLADALEKDAILSVWVADLVFARHALPRILSALSKGTMPMSTFPLWQLNRIIPALAQLPALPKTWNLVYRLPVPSSSVDRVPLGCADVSLDSPTLFLEFRHRTLRA